MKFIVFEGLDGAGKSTLMSALVEEIKARGHVPLVTREPGGTPLGETLRELLLRKSNSAPVPRAELLMYEAARAQHVDQIILPALKERRWVLCDRFSASTIAFQSGGRKISDEKIKMVDSFATDGLQPDLYVLLDLTTQEAQSRMVGRELDRFESELGPFHERVRQSYLEQARGDSDRWLILDAAKGPDELRSILIQDLRSRGWFSE